MTSLRLADNHCHLGDETDEWLAAAREAGVARFIDVGCDLETSLGAIDKANKHADVWATAGIHPHEAAPALDAGELARIEELLSAPRVVGVGECGLDYFYDHSPRDAQKEVFVAQIQMAHRHDTTLVIHTRDAWDDTFEILDAEGAPANTVFHCFTGGPVEAAAALERGAFLSFSGIVTFKSAQDVRDAAQITPLDRILIETDSPYLAPVPHRGKRNQPAFVAFVAEAIAETVGRDVADVIHATWDNTERAYPKLVM